ncbi:MAG TPA: hypothetical protein VGI95_17275 [Caulobacteraceae bacterium]|jgi:hypothetical protein
MAGFGKLVPEGDPAIETADRWAIRKSAVVDGCLGLSKDIAAASGGKLSPEQAFAQLMRDEPALAVACGVG